MAGYQLQEIPTDVYNFLVDEQARLKKKHKRTFSMERIIYRAVRLAKLHAEKMNDDELDKMEKA